MTGQCNDSKLIKPYTVSKGAIHWVKQVRDGCVLVPLCDFTARIKECIHWDDGAKLPRTLLSRAKHVTAEDFPLLRCLRLLLPH
jgi:hypothetical protein